MSGLLPLSATDPPIAAMLLVMVPPLARRGGAPAQFFSAADQAALQRQLGAAVQVLTIDEANYPAVVRSFAPLQLPAYVLVHEGRELWRQQGLPHADEVVPLVLAKVAPDWVESAG